MIHAMSAETRPSASMGLGMHRRVGASGAIADSKMARLKDARLVTGATAGRPFGRPDSHHARGFGVEGAAVNGSQAGAAFQVADDDGGDVDAVDLA